MCTTVSTCEQKPRFCILGAGNGGQAMAAHLALKGFEVHLYNRSPERLGPLIRHHVIQLSASQDNIDLPHGKAVLRLVTSNIEDALDGCEILMVVVPANGHSFMAQRCAPFLRDGQLVVLHPGRTGGALEFANVLQNLNCTADVIVAEAQTLLYACRAVNIGHVQLFGIKNSVPVAALPAYKIPQVIKRLSVAFDEFIPGDNVIKTSLENIGAIFHPAVTVLNSARIESTRGEFEFYIEGISPSVATILEQLDAERVAVGAALGYRLVTAREWLYLAYGAAGKTLFDAIRANQGYYGINAPNYLAHRYLTEDVPMSLVPIASLGQLLGVDCSTTRSIIQLAGVLHGCDYQAVGRTATSMGFAGHSVQEIRRMAVEGVSSRQKRRAARSRRQLSVVR